MHEIEIASKVLREAKKAGATKYIEVEVGELSEITPTELKEGLIKVSSGSLDIEHLRRNLEHPNEVENHTHQLDFSELEEHKHNAQSWKFNVLHKKSKVQCPCGYKGKANIADRGHGYCIFNCPKCNKKPEVLDGGEIKIVSIE